VLDPQTFYRLVSPSKDLRDAATKAENILLNYSVEASMRLDLFQAQLATEMNLKSSGEWDRLDSESRRLVEKMILDGKRAGLAWVCVLLLPFVLRQLSSVRYTYSLVFAADMYATVFKKAPLDPALVAFAFQLAPDTNNKFFAPGIFGSSPQFRCFYEGAVWNNTQSSNIIEKCWSFS
jgi:hypothetical protein